MVVDENYGDIIFTQEFERCKNRHGLAVHICRKSDPESKGMVESGVKFVKYNFARGREFVNLEQWSQDSDAWLVRTGNGRKHDETKKIPAEVFQSEKLHLKPVISLTTFGDNVVTAAVMDRLLHKCELFNIDGDSWRLENQQSILKDLLVESTVQTKRGRKHGSHKS